MSADNSPEAMRVYMDLERAMRAGREEDLPPEVVTAPGYPNSLDPYTHTPIFALALSWSPLPFVRALLAAGAEPNYEALDGFPALQSVVMSDRDDRVALIELLIEAGADLDVHGFNGWTPLHAAAVRNDVEVTTLLLSAGADPLVRTGIDDNNTVVEEARRANATEAVRAIEAWLAAQEP